VGSEIVGLLPQAALDQVIDYYLQLEHFTPEMVIERRLSDILGP
jgi:glutamate formiminotransferase